MGLSYHGDGEYAHRNLRGTVVMKGAEPVLIKEVAGDVVYYKNLNNGEVYYSPSVEFNFSSPKLGYVNHLGRAKYIMRKPQRQWRQGFHNQLTTHDGGRWNPDLTLAQCINNNYPSIEECLRRIIEEGNESCAFSRSFALVSVARANPDVGLEYKGTCVGLIKKEYVSTDKLEVRWQPPYEYLREHLQYEVNK